MIPELNEVKLIDALSLLITDWVKDVRFTVERNSDIGMTINDMSATPKVYKYWLPPVDSASDVPFGPPLQDNDEKKLFPCIIVRPTGSEVSPEENGFNSETFSVDFVIFVSEHDVLNRYNFAYLAKKVIVNGLLRLTNSTVDSIFMLDKNITSTPFDDEQRPKSGLIISTKWKCALPANGSSLLHQNTIY